eukprot:CAMPEP_0181463626 /NCGR_PEP_ID=MMETSP1110-20121109/35010_1 /TAXON_ID=174948 /ORGANISM="Symbiodinium sp., Strain CCMP421" /LENGTH=220 /DNA_ID=CAMNT_0023588327 /DNA_START=33 /DNA_END=692 /DNA_ORIENTATION=+
MSRIKAFFSKCAGFSGGLISGSSEFPQFLILGLDRSGKTTLLYRLKIGSGWTNIHEEMEKMRTPNEDGKVEDPGYHYEELNRFFSCGVWEVPGTEAMRHLWKLFYQSIKIHCVVFVVDGGEAEERINLAKRHLHVLMNEAELRNACFCVVINQRLDEKKNPVYDEKEDVLKYKLGLHELHHSVDWRTKHFIMNILDLKGESDKEWAQLMAFAKEVLCNSR